MPLNIQKSEGSHYGSMAELAYAVVPKTIILVMCGFDSRCSYQRRQVPHTNLPPDIFCCYDTSSAL